MDYEAKIFRHDTFGSLRVVTIDDTHWFAGKDVATSLGYKNPQKAIREHVDPQDKREERMFTPGGVQKIVLINKSGVYSLILDSQLPKAKEYRHWVTSEVLPQVDETGSYSPAVPAVETAPASVVEILEYRIYAHLLSDGNVKIGCTKRFIARAGEVERETGLKIVDVYFTPKMSYENAHLIEWCVKKNLAPNHVKGEIYSVALAKARVTITHYMQMTFVTLPTESVKRIADKQD